MDHKVVIKEMDLKLETGKLAQQADAAVVASLGETVVLVTVATKPSVEDPGYFPLSVEYVEKYYAGGRITAQKFIKRESRPSDKAILSGRAIDRSIRPLFPKDFRNEVQVILTVLSFDGVNDPAMIGFIGASAALSISSVPFAGPIAVTQIGEKDGSVVVNPIMADLEHLNLLLTVASTDKKVVMVEAEGKEVKDEDVVAGIKQAVAEGQAQIKLIQEFVKEAGKEKMTVAPVVEEVDEKVLAEAKKVAHEKIEALMFDETKTWHDSMGDLIQAELAEQFAEKLNSRQITAIFEKTAKEIMNDLVINKKRRVDGRKMDEVRALNMEVGLLPRAHGSALFERGESQVLSVATIGPLSLSQTLEGMEGESTKRFMQHYNMGINPFASGEVKRIGSPNRRDIGHGDLVERSILGVLPTEDEFPYAIRVVSEVLGANASTSQASVCGSILALLNAGVPVKPVAGIAIGLLTDHDDESKFQVLTDMQAVEDFFGEMDFKVAGTTEGITGIQMDTKLQGLTMEIVEEAIKQAKAAREFILEKMKAVMPKPGEISQYAPKIRTTHIKPEEIGMLIGPGGKNINGIIAKTGAQIDIEDDGTVMISSTDESSIEQAMAAVEGMFKQITPGEVYEGKVVRLAPFGAFVEIAPGKDGLVHVSQMAPGHVEKPEDIVSEGQTVKVRVTDVDAQGKVALSMLFGDDVKPESEGRPRSRGGFGGGERRGFDSRGPRRDFGGSRDGGDKPSFSSSRPRRDFGGDRPRRNFGNRDDRGGSRGGGRGGNRGGNRGGFNR
jgi:polyribonucleotide nucleotidyltransferase